MVSGFMDNVKGDSYYLKRLLTDLQFLIGHTQRKTQTEIESNPLLVDSIMFRMIQISENVDKLTLAFKDRYEIPWQAMKGMRNRIVHDYGVVDMKIVYDTVINDIPKIYERLSFITI